MLNLINARTCMKLAITTHNSINHAEADTRADSPLTPPENDLTQPQDAPPHLGASLKFGPIWLREAQRTAASPPTSPISQDVPQSLPTATAAIKQILCQPPTPEMHRDTLRNAFLSLSSSF